MDLKFLGRGSAFNYKEGNTSAYFIENNELFLIDCGETTFSKLMEKALLENKTKIHIIITHTHSDHIGSLGSLLTYTYYKLKQKVNIIISENKKQKTEIESVLESFGIEKAAYDFIYTKEYENKYESFSSINYLKTEHTPLLNCFSIIFETKEGKIFYSGDTYEINLLEVLLKRKDEFTKIYLDMCNEKENIVHMYIENIKEVISSDLKNRVYGMHFNNDECMKKALSYGFNIVEIDK